MRRGKAMRQSNGCAINLGTEGGKRGDLPTGRSEHNPYRCWKRCHRGGCVGSRTRDRRRGSGWIEHGVELYCLGRGNVDDTTHHRDVGGKC